MSLTETTYLVVGASFALYIFIAIRSRAGSTQEFYVAGKGIHPWPTAWRRPLTGCQPPRSSPWPVSLVSLTTAMAARYF